MFYNPGPYIADIAAIFCANIRGIQAGRPVEELEQEARLAHLKALRCDIERQQRAATMAFWVELGVIVLVVGGLALLAWRLRG